MRPGVVEIHGTGQRWNGIGTWVLRGGSFLFLLLFTVAPLFGDSPSAKYSPYDWAFVCLDNSRHEKVEQLRRFCDRIHGLAARAREDDVLLRFFELNAKCHALRQSGSPPEEFTRKTTEFRKAFNEYYIQNWLAFYDILFVDRSGTVFYTIRRDGNYEQNLFEGSQSQSPLARCLKETPESEAFVDFSYYESSGEPAAFVVEPVHIRGEHRGWMVLQCAINKINSIFAGSETLGETGETFLVNHQGYMLTESNFEGQSTILEKKLSNDNVQAKFHDGEGHRRVTDYRGFAALTSFEVVEFLGTSWLVVAKVDEAQITTEHYKQHRHYYADRIIEHLSEMPVGGSHEAFMTDDRKTIRVDMDEFVKADHGEILQTLGVSTCTAVVATYPGKFGYLAHISPLDRIYGTDGTNLLGHVTKKIRTYDIYKYERRRVRFVIVARHFDSLINIVDKLVDDGFLLSQISVLYHPQARCANVTYDYSQDRISVEWVFDQPQTAVRVHHGDDGRDLATIVRTSMGE